MSFLQLIDDKVLTGKKISLPPGSFIYREGDSMKTFGILVSGMIKRTQINDQGLEIITDLIKPGDCLEKNVLFKKNVEHKTNAQCVTSVEYIEISKTNLETELAGRADLLLIYLKKMQEDQLDLQGRLTQVLFYDKQDLLNFTLVELVQQYGVNTPEGMLLEPSFTNQELANMIGSTRESVNRFLKKLKDKHILSTERNRLVIHDFEGLCLELPTDISYYFPMNMSM